MIFPLHLATNNSLTKTLRERYPQEKNDSHKEEG
jgi:hypothetical protein